MKKLGIIGSGNIAEIVLELFNSNNLDEIFAFDIDELKLHKFIDKFKNKQIKPCKSIHEIIKFSDVILETASIEAVKEIFRNIKLFNKEKIYIFLSVGGVLKNYKEYKSLIKNGYKILIPSGAIAGCDALAALSYSKIHSIHLKTIKPPQMLLSNCLYFKKRQKLYNEIQKKQSVVIFKGDVYDAIKYFPQNINVAATLAVVSGVPKKIKVTIVADRRVKRNIHEITINSSAGNLFVKTENVPSPKNPKTSYLAALSVLPILYQVI